jgi:sialic acid synthase SpsE
MNELGVTAFKIDARDVTRRPFIEHVSRKNKPVLLSTGMTTGDEIESVIDWMRKQSNARAILLHGASSNSPSEELHLKSIEYLRERFGLPVGFSDCSAGSLGATVAVSVGAQVIERHLLIETRGDAPDFVVSMDAKELKKHIEELRTIGRMLGFRPDFLSRAGAKRKVRADRAFYPQVTAFPEHRSAVIGSYAR